MSVIITVNRPNYIPSKIFPSKLDTTEIEGVF
jgi:hypothetical protein